MKVRRAVRAPDASTVRDAELSEPSQRAAYAKRLCKHLPKPPRCYEWVDAKSQVCGSRRSVVAAATVAPPATRRACCGAPGLQAVSAVVGGMKLSGKNDELLILRANHSQPDKGWHFVCALARALRISAFSRARRPAQPGQAVCSGSS